MKFKANEFTSIVVDDSSRSRISTKPVDVKEVSSVFGHLVLHHKKLDPSEACIGNCEKV